MERYLTRLSNQLIRKMGENDWSITQLSTICNVSYHGIYNIINGNVSDINLSTLIKICENTHISYADIFDIDNTELLDHTMKKLRPFQVLCKLKKLI